MNPAYLLKRRHSQLVKEPIIAIPPLFIFLFIVSHIFEKINTFPVNGNFFTKFSIYMDKKLKINTIQRQLLLMGMNFLVLTVDRLYVTVELVLIELIRVI